MDLRCAITSVVILKHFALRSNLLVWIWCPHRRGLCPAPAQKKASFSPRRVIFIWIKGPNSPFVTVRLWASIKLLGTILAVTDVSWIKLNWIKVTLLRSADHPFFSEILGKFFLKTSVSQIRSVLWLLRMINVWISPSGPLWFLFYRLQHNFTH